MAHTQSHSLTGALVDTAVSVATSLVARAQLFMKRRAVYNRTMNELGQLTNADLSDLGLSRSQFHFIAKEAAENV